MISYLRLVCLPCVQRLLRTNLTEAEVGPVREQLAQVGLVV